MCVPAIAAMTATQLATASLAIQGVTAVAQMAAAADTAKKKNQAYVANTQSAKDAYFLKTKQSNLRIQQEQARTLQQKLDADLKERKASATALAAAAGSGVQGANVAQLIADFERSEGMYNDRVDERMEGIAQQTAMNQLGYQAEAISRINSMQPVGMAETLFAVAEQLADFGVSYFDTKAPYANI